MKIKKFRQFFNFSWLKIIFMNLIFISFANFYLISLTVAARFMRFVFAGNIGFNSLGSLKSGELAFNYTNFNIGKSIRFFSEEKDRFKRDLTSCQIAVCMLQLTVRKSISLLKEMENLDEKCKDFVEVNTLDEIEAYSIKKKFPFFVKEIEVVVSALISDLDSLVIVLARKPDWAEPVELKSLQEDLRELVASFFSSAELARSVGATFMFADGRLKTFLEHNKISEYFSEMKTCIALLSKNLKKDLPYLSFLLKRVRWRLSWLNDVQREEALLKFRRINAEKKKVSRARLIALRKHNKLVRANKKAWRELLYGSKK